MNLPARLRFLGFLLLILFSGLVSLQAVTLSSRPLSRATTAGGSTTFSVTASGTGNTFVWRHNRQVIPGETGSSLTLSNLTAADAGIYHVTVTGSDLSTATSVACLVVDLPNTEITAWGPHAPAVPAMGGGVRAIAQSAVSVAVKTDGTVVQWDSDSSAFWTWGAMPVGLNNVVAIATAGSHIVALRDNGTVALWGADFLGSSPGHAALSDVVAIATGTNHALALKSDGTVFGWGVSTDLVAGTLTNIVAIAAGDDFSVALKADGSIIAWGQNPFGETNVPAGVTEVIGISSGKRHTLLLKSDGTVATFGAIDLYSRLALPAGLNNVRAVSAGGFFSYVVKADGTIFGWGGNGITAEPPEGLGSVVSLAIADGEALAISQVAPPTVTSDPSAQVKVEGDHATFTVAANGAVPLSYQWRRDGVPLADGGGILGSNASTLVLDPVTSTHGGNYDVVIENRVGTAASAAATLTVKVPPAFTERPLSRLVGLGSTVTFSATATDSGAFTYRWRHRGQDIPGATGATLTLPSVAWSDRGAYEVVVTNADAARTSTFRLEVSPVSIPEATAIGWGMKNANLSVDPASPPLMLRNLVGIAGGQVHAGAVDAAGNVSVWGNDAFGAMTVPPGIVDVVEVAVGDYHTTALLADGRVMSWGDYSDSTPPVPAGLRGVVAISTRGSHNLALKADGTVVSWGGPTAPAVPPGLTDVVEISAGLFFGVALKRDGTVVAWGDNMEGQSSVPAGLTGIVAIAAGDRHAVVLKADGNVVAWGDDYSGQATVPAGLAGVVAIAAGARHSVVLKGNGSLAGWGDDTYGQGASSSAQTGIAALTAGTYFNLGLTPVVMPAIDAAPTAQSAILGRHAIFTVTASGTGLQYQWRRNGVDITNNPTAFTSQLVVDNVSDGDEADYDVVVTNSLGSVTSGAVALQLTRPPQFLQRPRTRIAGVGENIALSATLDSLAGVTFQWKHNGRAINGATNSTLALDPVRWEDAGYYELVATNAEGSGSTTFALTVGAAFGYETQVIGWGDHLGAATVMRDVSDVVGVAAGNGGTQLLLENGDLMAGGQVVDLSSLDPTVRPVAIASDDWSNVVLLSNGRVRILSNSLMLLDNPATRHLYDVVQIAPAGSHVYALRADGTIVTWRNDSDAPFTVVAGISSAVSIAGRGNAVVAVKADGTVVASGASVPVGLSGVRTVAGGVGFFAALKSDGTVVVWGTASVATQVPAGLSGIRSVSAQSSHIAVVRENGRVSEWGNTFTGVVPMPPQQVNGAAVMLDAGSYHDVAVVYKLHQPTAGAVADRAAQVGDTITLTASATGGLLDYQWRRNGAPLAEGGRFSGTNTGTLTIAGLTPDDGGSYDLVVTNTRGSATAPAGALSVFLGTNDLAFLGVVLPASVPAVTRVPLTVQVANTGTRNWTGSHFLVLQDEAGSVLSAAALAGTGRGGSATLHFQFMAPAATGPHTYRLRARENGGEWFGPPQELTLNVTVNPGGDFNRDGQPDLLWQNAATGQRALWLMNGGDFTPMQIVSLGWVDATWSMAAATDFNTDGNVDILWQNTVTGQRALWLMNGGDFTPTQIVSLGWVSPEWTMAAATDFNADGKVDILWQNTVTGQRALWLMNGGDFTPTQIVSLGWVSPEWSMAAATDFNADGKVDILWQNTVTGQRALWLMNGGDFTPTQIVSLGWVSPEWSMASAVDFNADAKIDILWQNTVTGQRALWLMNGGDFTPTQIVNLGDVPAEWEIAL